jgi:predicted enzyme related to lactoylglutathione lyase
VSVKFKTVLYPVKDLDQAKATFTALFGVEPHADSPYYAGYEIDGSEIGLVPGGHDQGMTGPEAYYDVEDINATLDALKVAGAVVVQEPRDVAMGLLVAKVRDTEGNIVGVRQPPASA